MTTEILWVLGLVAAVIAVCVTISKLEAKDIEAARRRVHDRSLELLADYAVVMVTHEETLRLRLRQLAYQDAYGRWIMDKAFKELSYFFDEVLVPEVRPQSEEELAQLRRTFDSWVLTLDDEEPETATPEVRNRDGRDYERAIASRLAEAGFDVRFTPSSGDQGVDLIASRDDLRIAIQCKDYSKPAGNDAVQQVFSGARFYEADRAIVVAPNDFTLAARQLASSLKVDCVHHDELSLLLAATQTQAKAIS